VWHPPSCARAGVLLAPMARPSCVPRAQHHSNAVAQAPPPCFRAPPNPSRQPQIRGHQLATAPLLRPARPWPAPTRPLMSACLLHPVVFLLGACCRPPVLRPASAARRCSSLLGATAWPSYSSYGAPHCPCFLFSPARALLGALTSSSSRTDGALCPMVVGLPGSHGDQRSSASPFDLLLSPAPFTPLARSGAGPCPAGPASPPTPFIAFAGSVAAAAFPARSTLPRPFRLDLPSLWLDRVFPAGSVAVVAFLAGSAVSSSILPRARTP
jgi:hypothetical protein